MWCCNLTNVWTHFRRYINYYFLLIVLLFFGCGLPFPLCQDWLEWDTRTTKVIASVCVLIYRRNILVQMRTVWWEISVPSFSSMEKSSGRKGNFAKYWQHKLTGRGRRRKHMVELNVRTETAVVQKDDSRCLRCRPNFLFQVSTVFILFFVTVTNKVFKVYFRCWWPQAEDAWEHEHRREEITGMWRKCKMRGYILHQVLLGWSRRMEWERHVTCMAVKSSTHKGFGTKTWRG